MRSSESANMIAISTWMPKVMRSGKTKNAAMMSSHGTASAQCQLARRTMKASARSRYGKAAAPTRIAVARTVTSLSAIKAFRLDQEDEHGQRIDEEAAGIRIDVFAANIEDTEQHGREQRSLEAAKPANRDNDQKEHEIEHGEARCESEGLDGEATAERGEPAADGKGRGEQTIDIDADRLRHAPIVDSSPDLGADIRALEAVPEDGDEDGADNDDEGAIGRHRPHADIDLPGEKLRQRHGERRRPVKIRVAGDRHEGEPDGQQHLIELGRLVEARIEQPLEGN